MVKHLNITQSDVNAAYQRFREFSRSAANKNTVLRFYKFLGMCANIYDDEAIRRMEILVGPHGRAYFKAWLVQNGDQ